MEILSKLLIGIVAVEHLYILYMEMFAWETLGKKTFKGSLKDEMFTPTKSLAANQGLYNGFLSAGLIWSLIISDEIWAKKCCFIFSWMCYRCGNLRSINGLEENIFRSGFARIFSINCGLVELNLEKCTSKNLPLQFFP